MDACCAWNCDPGKFTTKFSPTLSYKCIEVCTHEARMGIEWWKMGIWRLKGAWGNTDQGMCPICSKEEGWTHILRCEETKRWRDELVDDASSQRIPSRGLCLAGNSLPRADSRRPMMKGAAESWLIPPSDPERAIFKGVQELGRICPQTQGRQPNERWTRVLTGLTPHTQSSVITRFNLCE
jgi:hypothetical protein